DVVAAVLPYRTDAGGLLRWLQAQARSRDAGAARQRGFSAKSAEGALVTAAALGFLDRERGEPTPAGQRLLLGDAAERTRLLRRAVLEYAPYRAVIEAARAERD